MLALTDLRENFDNDSEILSAVLAMFMEEVPADYELLKHHIATGNFKEAGLQAHKVKSSYRTLGIDHMATILQEIETRGREENNVQEIPAYMDRFNAEYDSVMNEVAETMQNL